MIGAKQDLVAEDNSTISGVSGVTVPFAPPAGACIAGRSVIGVATVKIDCISTTGVAVRGGRIMKAGVKVDSNEVPTRP